MTVNGVKTVYNDLQAETVCDTLFRAITSVEMPEVVPVNETTSVLRYEVRGTCRGCEEPVLFEDSINRDVSGGRALSGGPVPSFMDNGRELVTTCTCPAGADTRGLVQADFVAGYNEWIELKTEEGVVENLQELLGLTEEGTFVTASPEPTSTINGALSPNFCGSFPRVLLYSFFTVKMLKKML